MSYDGAVDAKIGEDRKNTTASNCFIHSGDALFIRINKQAACASAIEDEMLNSEINIYPNPSDGRVNIDYGNQFDQILNVSLFNVNGQMIRNIDKNNDLIIEEKGVYLIQITTADASVSRKVIIL